MSLDLPEAKNFKKSTTKLYIIRTLCALPLMAMKLKYNDPGKVWAKLAYWFKSYGKKKFHL